MAPLFWLAGPLTLYRAAVLGGGVAVLVAPWVAFNLVTTGTPLPATASAKIEGGLVGFLSGAREPLGTALLWRPWQFETEWVRWLFSVDVLLPILALVGLWGLSRRRGRAAVCARPPWCCTRSAWRSSRHTAVPGSRRAAIRSTCCRWPSPWRWPLLRRCRAPPGSAVCCAPSSRAPSSVAPSGVFLAAATRYAWAVQNIDAMQVRLGQWIAARTPPGARLGLNDVGAIAYLSRREVVDVMGLVTPAIIPYRRDGERGVLAFLERACPDYLVIFPEWFPRLSSMRDRFTPIHQIRLDPQHRGRRRPPGGARKPWSRWKRAVRCPHPPVS